MTQALKHWIEYCKQNDFAMLASMIVLAFVLSLLAGCAGGGSQPVVTDDDLTPGSVVQTALDLEAGNGRTYAYYFHPDSYYTLSWEEAEAKLRDEQAEMIRDMQDMIAKAEESASAEDIERMKSNLNEMQNPDYMDALLAQQRQAWEIRHNLDPVVSPQEAANRAGWMFEEVYGIDLTGKELRLDCYPYDRDRILWSACADPDGLILCELDATTGEIVYAGYGWDAEESERMQQSPEADCFIRTSPDDYQGHWDPDAPSYQQTMEKIMATVQSEISGSPLVSGAAVTDIEVELMLENSRLDLHLTCDNGKTYVLHRFDARTEYDFGGYPLRAYGFANPAYE